MYRGIASKEIVVKMGKAGMMGFLGTGGLSLDRIEADIKYIQSNLNEGQSYGLNLLHNPSEPKMEVKTAELYIKYGVKNIEASAYMSITPALVRYRAHGLTRSPQGNILIANRIMAKVSRPEVAEIFLSPAPERIVNKLVKDHVISHEEAELLEGIPMADDLCVEADSGGHTDMGVAYVLMPAMIKLRDEMINKYSYSKKIRIGAAGGIGTPEAAAAAFVLGADFILTGSINQCTVEAFQSETVKDMLQQINVQDTDYAPAGDMFEFGAKVQVVKRGVFFPARANRLYELYKHYNSLDEIDPKIKKQLEEKYFKKSLEGVYRDVEAHYNPDELEKARTNPKYKMALIFKWYLGYSSRLAISGDPDNKVDYQVHCGPALGAFNQWVHGTEMENWRNRHVDKIGQLIMDETAKLLDQRLHSLLA
jgi:trans-AT polyketide synthase/acyltransferase/oxidoreductase domain-containing protein